MISLPFLLLCAASCRQPLEPSIGAPEIISVSQSIATDSACRTVTITLVGSNNLNVVYPDRNQCGSGLVLIPGGAPTRNGPGKRNVNLPVRLLNQSGYTIQSPATVVLSPLGRVVINPAGQPASKLVPQNADSVRAGTGEWIWLTGAAGTVGIGDSTAARTMVIRLDSPVTTGQVAFTMEATQLTSMGWVLLTSNSPNIDTTKLIERPGTDMVLYRTTLMLRFEDGVSDDVKQSFFTQNGLTVLGVTTSRFFYVTFDDPGTSIAAFDAVQESLRASSLVRLVLEAFHSGGIIPHNAARFPSDSLKRWSWLFSTPGAADTLWAMRAIRVPQAWGCETGTYCRFSPPMDLVVRSFSRPFPPCS